MAVTMTAGELVAALRLNNTPEEQAEVTRLLAFASEAVVKHAPTAPDATHNEAARRLAGYLFDMPEAGRGDAYANAMRNSGAARMLLPYRVHRAGYADAVASAQEAVGTVGNPVTGLAVVGSELVVTFADNTTESLTLPAGMGGTGVDQTARDLAQDARTAALAAQVDADTAGTAASTAQGTANSAQTDADAAQADADTAQADIDDHEANHPSGDGGVDDAAVLALIAVHAGMPNVHHAPGGTGVLSVNDGRLPAAPVQARLAWKDASESVTATSFGADSADAMTDLILIPDYPQAFLDAGVTTATLIFWAATDSDPASFDPFDSDEVDFGGTALTVGGVAGQYWLTVDLRSQYISGTPITILLPGVLIATQPWVTEQIADGGGGGGADPIEPTPPVVLVDAAAYAAHGDVTAEGWRDYDFVQFLFANGGNTYQTEPVNTARLLAQAPIIVSVGRNVHWALSFSTSDDDTLTIATSAGNSVPVPNATSTITIIAW